MLKHTDKVKGLKEKARALEDSFFAKENERILKELREASAREEKKKEFREYLNIDTPIKPDHASDALGLALLGLFRYSTNAGTP